MTYRFQATMHSQRSYPYATGNSTTGDGANPLNESKVSRV